MLGSAPRVDPFHLLHLDELQRHCQGSTVLLGWREVYHYMYETIAKGAVNACLVQDDYHWWNSHSRSYTSGKVLFVDQTD